MSDTTDADDDLEPIEREVDRALEFLKTMQRCILAGVHMDPDQAMDAIGSYLDRCIAACDGAIVTPAAKAR